MKKIIILAAAFITSFFASCSTSPIADIHLPDLHLPFSKPKVVKTEYGIASWYSIRTNHGTRTASGRPLTDNGYTSAHKNFPFGSQIRVTNISNGISEILTVTDRGPFKRSRVVDVTIGSSKRLGFHSRGLTKVKVELLEGRDHKNKR